MSRRPAASVIIATLDRPALLAACLDSLDEHGGNLDREVIVVDQSRADATEAVCRGRPGVRYARSERLGISHNRNLGARMGNAPWIVFADDDGRCAPGWGAATEGWIRGDGSPDLVVGRVLCQVSGRPLAAAAGPESFLLDGERYWAANGASLAIRRSLFERLGGLDERLGAGTRWGAGEDHDLVLRALAVGAKAIYDPQVVVLHPPPASRADRSARRKQFLYSVGSGAMYRKSLPGPLGPALAPRARRIFLGPPFDYVRDGFRGVPGASTHLVMLAGRWMGLVAFPGPGGRAAAPAPPAVPDAESDVGLVRALARLLPWPARPR
ncbi:glycosyltransferase [Myxococcota bacterium]|nr:glycosyltransferase [Myxococcota bacterium]